MILSITVKIPKGKELAKLDEYKLFRKGILQTNLQINQNKVLGVLMANNNENGQQKNINN